MVFHALTFTRSWERCWKLIRPAHWLFPYTKKKKSMFSQYAAHIIKVKIVNLNYIANQVTSTCISNNANQRATCSSSNSYIIISHFCNFVSISFQTCLVRIFSWYLTIMLTSQFRQNIHSIHCLKHCVLLFVQTIWYFCHFSTTFTCSQHTS